MIYWRVFNFCCGFFLSSDRTLCFEEKQVYFQKFQPLIKLSRTKRNFSDNLEDNIFKLFKVLEMLPLSKSKAVVYIQYEKRSIQVVSRFSEQLQTQTVKKLGDNIKNFKIGWRQSLVQIKKSQTFVDIISWNFLTFLESFCSP